MGLVIGMLMIIGGLLMGHQTEDYAKAGWEGNYEMTQTCDGATNPRYTMKITADSSHIYLDNLGGYGTKVEATVQHESLDITPTDVSVGLMGKVRLSGTGLLQGGDITIQLNVDVPGPQGSTTTSVCELRGTPIGK